MNALSDRFREEIAYAEAAERRARRHRFALIAAFALSAAALVVACSALYVARSDLAERVAPVR